MRPGEVFTLISLTFSTIILFIPQRNRPFLFNVLPFILPVIILFHIFIEIPRWQMVPAYIFAGLILLITLIQLRKRKKEVRIFFHHKKKHPHLLLILVTLIILISIILLPLFLPVFSLPPPTGPYMVGTSLYTIHDESRPENITQDQDDYRKLVVKIWYPTEILHKGKKETYWQYPHLLSKYLAEEYNLPPFFFEYLGLVKTYSIADAEISENQEQFPVILCLHGGGCTDSVTDLRVLNEELASQGYIVIGLTHPYSSLPVVFSGGETAICIGERRETLKQQTLLSETLWNTYYKQQEIDQGELLQKIFDIETMKISEIGRRMGDIQTVINWMDKVNTGKIPGIMKGKYNTDKIGILGVHMGGSVAVNAFLLNERIKTCINLDGFHYTGLGEFKISKPYMLITSEESRLHTLGFIKNQLGNLSYLFSLKGSMRQSFTDYSLFSPLIDLFQLNGKLHYKQVVEITRNYIHTFYSTHLLGNESPSFKDLTGEYSEMVFSYAK